ncbi:DUF3418 domain-containing protein [Shigella flexneri]
MVATRKVNYSQINPALCRELFIRHALVKVTGRHVTHSSVKPETAGRSGRLEHKSRRRDISG